MLASGGSDSLIIWSLQQDDCQQIKNFGLKNSEQIQNQLATGSSGANYGGMVRIAPGSGQEENTGQKALVQDLNWSHDQLFLSAVIHDTVAFFDMRKLLKSIPSTDAGAAPHQPT